ncbi:MAG: hypothetical protein H8D56_01570 [Planctomycetes bacterium]|nr:hypothetical protein [Planctomycetota bacterium]MBL7143034.1 hypothetical protein [Phycisphaerae bacterium]
MSNINKNIDKDERALEALLAAAFRLDFPEEINDEKAEKIFQQSAKLSEEDKEEINSWGTDFIEKLIEGRKAKLDIRGKDIIVNEELEMEYMAMNRDKDVNGLNEETQRKIDEERKKALEEEEKKNDDKSNES